MPKPTWDNIIGSIVAVFIFGSVIYVYFIQDKFDFQNKGRENLGVITSNTDNSRSSPKIKHTVNGQDYVGSFVAQLPGLTVGEIFPLLYNPDNPKDVFVKRWQPLFLPHEATGKTTGKITYITELGFGVKQPGVSFEYVEPFNGQKIERSQKIPQDYKLKFPDLLLGQHYEVEYWQENPKRAIIYLDRAVGTLNR